MKLVDSGEPFDNGADNESLRLWQKVSIAVLGIAGVTLPVVGIRGLMQDSEYRASQKPAILTALQADGFDAKDGLEGIRFTSPDRGLVEVVLNLGNCAIPVDAVATTDQSGNIVDTRDYSFSGYTLPRIVTRSERVGTVGRDDYLAHEGESITFTFQNSEDFAANIAGEKPCETFAQDFAPNTTVQR